MKEYIFGIIPHPVEKKIEWHINLLDEFGVDNYYFNGQYISLKCAERKSANDVPQVEITGEGFEIEIIYGNNQKIELKK